MKTPAQSFVLDRYTLMGDLTAAIRPMLNRSSKILALIVTAVAVELVLNDRPGAVAFGLMSIGTIIPLLIWSGKGIGVPLMPMLVLQHLIIYGLPIASRQPAVGLAPPDDLFIAGREMILFLLAIAAAWRMGMELFRPAPPIAYALQGIDKEGVKGLTRLGFGLVGVSTGYLILQNAGMTDIVLGVLPAGSAPIFWAGISAASACGFFLCSMIVTNADVPGWVRSVFWTLLACNCLINASGFLLSGAGMVVAAVIIGLFWGSGRVPWRFTIIIIAALSFLNLGKATMRERYWHPDDDGTMPSSGGALGLPGRYIEWAVASYDALTGVPDEKPGAVFDSDTPEKPQTLLERVNNLQNLLFVIDAMNHGVPALHGATYSLIPPLLVPRILWPDKPRTHEGQVLLNTHFGRQDLQNTFKTYIAWGLLPEAYGNFGPVAGALILGLAIGLFCAWAENATARKPVLSAEGFVSFAIFMGLANSYEMVASVMITSIFQSVVPVAVACAPFVRRMVVKRPEPA